MFLLKANWKQSRTNPYPLVFDGFITLDNEDKQNAILAEIARTKQAEEDKKRAEEEARKKSEDERKAAFAAKMPSSTRPRAKSIDEMFSQDYHAAHLARKPVLTYQQIEEQFGIQISGFGRCSFRLLAGPAETLFIMTSGPRMEIIFTPVRVKLGTSL